MRFIPNAIVFLALLAPVHLIVRPTPHRLMATALVLFSFASLGWGFAHHLVLARDHADLWAGVAAPIHREHARLPLVLEPPPGEPADEWDRGVPFVSTSLHMATLYAIEQGGVPAYLFAGVGAIHALSYRPQPDGIPMPERPARGYEWGLWSPAARADPTMRERALAHMLGYAPAYDDVMLWGTEADRAILRGRGFAVDFERGGVTIAHFVGCPARVRIVPPASGLPPTLLLAGWWPDSRPTFSSTLAARASSESFDLPLPQSPCGAVWIRVLFDMNGDGQLSAGDRLCAGADRNAVLRHTLGPGADTIVCAASEPVP